MPRLYRPTIPVGVRCRVILRQLGEMFVEDTLAAHKGKLGFLLLGCLNQFASVTACEVSDLRLDHDPPLGARPQERRGLGKKTYYIPDANDPAHLFYRPHGAQFAGSHDVKTRIRGDHGQYSDIALIKRERRRQKKKDVSRSVPSGFPKKASRAKNDTRSAVRKKFRWAKRKFSTRKDKS
jgi:hypothetical protein